MQSVQRPALVCLKADRPAFGPIAPPGSTQAAPSGSASAQPVRWVTRARSARAGGLQYIRSAPAGPWARFSGGIKQQPGNLETITAKQRRRDNHRMRQAVGVVVLPQPPAGPPRVPHHRRNVQHPAHPARGTVGFLDVQPTAGNHSTGWEARGRGFAGVRRLCLDGGRPHLVSSVSVFQQQRGMGSRSPTADQIGGIVTRRQRFAIGKRRRPLCLDSTAGEAAQVERHFPGVDRSQRRRTSALPFRRARRHPAKASIHGRPGCTSRPWQPLAPLPAR